jgi:uncharacterized protein (TIGR00369 family)
MSDDARSRIAALLEAGYAPHFRKSPVTQPWEPLYSRRHAERFELAFVVAPAHTNSRGLLHGGVVASLADNAMGIACVLASGHQGLLTISLAIDYFGSARVGDLVEVKAEAQRTGRSLCFGTCTVYAEGTPCAGGRATFRVPSQG